MHATKSEAARRSHSSGLCAQRCQCLRLMRCIFLCSLELSTFSQDSSAFGGRPAPAHTSQTVASFAREDHLSFNTQTSSQWDGLRHFGFRSTGTFYNGYTNAELEQSDVLGIQGQLSFRIDTTVADAMKDSVGQERWDSRSRRLDRLVQLAAIARSDGGPEFWLCYHSRRDSLRLILSTN